MVMIPVVGTVGPDGMVTGAITDNASAGGRYTINRDCVVCGKLTADGRCQECISSSAVSIADAIVKEAAEVGRCNMLIDNLDRMADKLCMEADGLREQATDRPVAVGVELHSVASALAAAAIRMYGLAATMRGDRYYFNPVNR